MQDGVVLYAAPGTGHVYSMLQLATFIHHHHPHLSLSLLLSPSPFSSSCAAVAAAAAAAANPFLSFVPLPRSPVVDTSPTRSRAAMAFEAIRLADPHLRRAVKEISERCNVRALVIDFFCTTAMKVAEEVGVPCYYYFTSGVAALAAYLYMPTIHQQVTPSFKDLNDTVLHIPGLPPIPATHMPEPLLDRNDPAYDDMVYFSSHLPESAGILVNTFDELEPTAMAAILNGSCVTNKPTPPIFNVGPLISNDLKFESVDHECLKWLDSQPIGSVIFLCFGSRGVFTAQQMKEISIGLERSGERFLWVVRNPIEVESEEIELGSLFSDGFLERVKERGMVVKNWAPQVAVLSHRTVAAFVTHCGWNSVLEATVAGKPMVAWPLYAEQYVNAVALVADGVAVPVERDGDGVVGAAEVGRRIRELMMSEKGRKVTKRVRVLREKGLDAWGETGSSTLALAKVVDSWGVNKSNAQ